MMEDPVFVAGCGFAAGLFASVPLGWFVRWLDEKFLRPRHPCDVWECPDCGHEEEDRER